MVGETVCKHGTDTGIHCVLCGDDSFIKKPVPSGVKYFDEDKGMTFNRQCPKCKTPTWTRVGIQTNYEGKRHLRNKSDHPSGDVVGVVHSTGKVKDIGIYCESCYIKLFEKGKSK